MEKTENSYSGVTGKVQQPAASALGRFDQPPTAEEAKAMQRDIIAAVIGLLCVLGVIGWALTL